MTTKNESAVMNPNNPANQVSEKWAAQFAAIIGRQFGALMSKAAVAEKPETVDAERITTPTELDQFGKLIGADFRAANGELFHIVNAMPEFSGFSAGGAGPVYARFLVQQFKWETSPDGNHVRKLTQGTDRLVDAKPFLASHKMLTQADDPNFITARELVEGLHQEH